MGFYVEGTRKGVQYRQVSRLDRVWFRQVSLYFNNKQEQYITAGVSDQINNGAL